MLNLQKKLLALAFLLVLIFINDVYSQWNDICGLNNGKRFYLENGESGSLMADYKNNVQAMKLNATTVTYKKCTVEFVTCPSCVVHVQFRFLNISRNCGKASVLDSCGCDYLWIYEPPIEDASGEQFCGRFLKNNITELTYIGQTRTVAFSFVYSNEYGHAFTLDYNTRRNRIHIVGQPKIGNMNNASQYITSPFFPHLYTKDLSVEYLIECQFIEPCRISVLFTDFLIDESSIIEIFDWNGQRMYVFSGNIFRPPVIISNGPEITIRFYANGASDYGFKATYSFILGILNDTTFKPNIGCGGYVNNLGGGITMMNMVDEGTKFFDCVWLIKPPENLLHRKTHLYVKVAEFINFAGTTELTIRQGLTSNQPSIEVLRHPMAHYGIHSKKIEHVVPIRQGFYISLRGVFIPNTRLAIVYAAFNYKDCFGAADFLCHNLRCIPILLNCDGFDHCGDNSDESSTCSQDPKDHREYSKIPNFLFPKMESYSDITTATFVFLTCSFGLIGIILAMALLLYRVNVRERHHRQIQDHIETIHAILEESVVDIEEELIVPDEPPDYEPPPEYNELIKMKFCEAYGNVGMDSKDNTLLKSSNQTRIIQSETTNSNEEHNCYSVASTSRSCQTTPVRIPQSPPPAYDYLDKSQRIKRENHKNILNNTDSCNEFNQPGPSGGSTNTDDVINSLEQAIKYLENLPKLSSNLLLGIKKGISNYKSTNFLKNTKKAVSCSEENLVRSFSDSELILNTKMTCWPSVSNSLNFKKSFSTDDLTSL